MKDIYQGLSKDFQWGLYQDSGMPLNYFNVFIFVTGTHCPALLAAWAMKTGKEMHVDEGASDKHLHSFCHVAVKECQILLQKYHQITILFPSHGNAFWKERGEVCVGGRGLGACSCIWYYKLLPLRLLQTTTTIEATANNVP